MTFALVVSFLLVSSQLLIASGIFPPETLVGHIPSTAKEGSPIVFDFPLQVERTTAGNVILSLEPNEFSNEFAIFPSVITAGQTFTVVLKHKHVLKRNKNITLEVRGQSEVTGESETKEVTITPDFFGRPLPQLLNLRYEAESSLYTDKAKILTMSMINLAGINESEFMYTLFGPFSERFFLQVSHNEIELWTNECREEEYLKTPKSTLLILRILDSTAMVSSRQYHILVHFAHDNLVAPRFKNRVYNMKVMEGASVMEDVVRIEAVDPDSDELTYSLGNHNSLFSINPTTGILSIQHPEWLTVDSLGETFNLTVFASDGKNKPDSATVVVNLMRKPSDEEEESVPFEKKSYDFTVEPGKIYVGQVSVESVNKQEVFYRISEGGAGVFSIDSHNGTIFYEGALRKNTQNYTLKVTATVAQSSRVDICTVNALISGIGSVPAQFSSRTAHRVEIDQAAPMNTVVYKFSAEDPDEGAVLRYSITEVQVFDILGNRIADSAILGEYFVFGSEGIQNGSLVLAQPIFDVNLMSFHLAVSVHDTAHPLEGSDYSQLIIRIVPVEMSMKPEQRVAASRMQSEIVIPDTLPIGSFVYTMSVNQAPAVLRNGHDVIFSLVNDRRFFSINKTTGVITTIASLQGLKTTNLTITAIHTRSQTSSPFTIPVRVVTVTNTAPHFEKSFYQLSVAENNIENAEIGRIRAVSDNELTYSITDSSYSGEVVAVNKKGVLSLKTSVDREQMSELSFFLTANDSTGAAATVPVQIEILDENDNRPSFRQESIIAVLSENSPIGTYVTKMEAYDLDNDNLTFSLMMNGLSDRLAAALHVDSLGRIVTAQALLGLDGKYQFAGIVRDGKNSASLPISLTISSTSRCQPLFSQNQSIVFFVTENNRKFESIGRVEAHTSAGCGLTYSFWSAENEKYINATERFAIDPDSGEITVTSVLDAEEVDRYTLITAAESSGLFALKAVEIRVEDSNDNVPMFVERSLRVETQENEPVGKVLARLKVNDPDKSDVVYFHLRDSFDQRFKLDLESGVLRLGKELDREERNFYELHIIASNSAELNENEPFDEIVVTVHVADMNDNGPLFTQPTYSVLVDRNAEAGRPIATVYARDPDFSSDKKSVTYYIDTTIFSYRGHARPVQRVFNINEHTGEITLGQSVKDFIGGRFEINLISADSVDKNANIDHSTVKVWVYDESELVTFVLEQSVLGVDSTFLEGISKALEETISCKVMVESLRYAHMSGEVVRDAAQLSYIVLNATTEEIIPSEKAISLIEKRSLTSKNPKLAKLNLHNNDVQQMDAYKLPSYVGLLVILVSVFAFLMIVILVVFGLVLCYYRAGFLNAKRRIEQEKIAEGRANKAHRYKQPPPVLTQSVNSLRELGVVNPRKSSYSVQEIKMSVGSEEARHRQSTQDK